MHVAEILRNQKNKRSGSGSGVWHERRQVFIEPQDVRISAFCICFISSSFCQFSVSHLFVFSSQLHLRDFQHVARMLIFNQSVTILIRKEEGIREKYHCLLVWAELTLAVFWHALFLYSYSCHSWWWERCHSLNVLLIILVLCLHFPNLAWVVLNKWYVRITENICSFFFFFFKEHSLQVQLITNFIP